MGVNTGSISLEKFITMLHKQITDDAKAVETVQQDQAAFVTPALKQHLLLRKRLAEIELSGME